MPKNVQAVALATGIEKVPYETGFDQHATVFDLKPGDVISWPHLCPHRIDNQEDLNVSLSLEALTLASRLRMGAHFFDGYVNKVFKSDMASVEPAKPIGLIKTGLSACIKKIGLHHVHHEDVVPSFRLNMDAPHCIEPI